jgi:hypothetical protein
MDVEEWVAREPRSPLEIEVYAGNLATWRQVLADEGHRFGGDTFHRNARTGQWTKQSYCASCRAFRTRE